MGFTDYALDKFVAQEISTAAIHVDSLAGELSGYEGWLNQFVMRRIFHAHVSDDRAALAFIMVRKAVAALAEWESMRATAALGVRRPSVYFEALRHCENCIAACSQGVEFGRRVLGIELFSKGDGSEFQRLNAIYNQGRHFHPGELPPGDLINRGQTPYFTLMAMHNPPHSGVHHQLYLDPNNLSGRELAGKLDVAASTLNRILAGTGEYIRGQTPFCFSSRLTGMS